MNDTPRTDAEHKYFFSSITGLRDPSRDYVPINFARELERELAAAIKERDKARTEYRKLDDYIQGCMT